MENQFLRIFETLIKNTIIPYFIRENEFSNISKELNALISCCRTSKKSFRHNFESRCIYMINRITELDGLKHAKNIIFGQNFNHSLEPNIFPEFLSLLIFGHDFNQSLEPNIFPNSLKQLR